MKRLIEFVYSPFFSQKNKPNTVIFWKVLENELKRIKPFQTNKRNSHWEFISVDLHWRFINLRFFSAINRWKLKGTVHFDRFALFQYFFLLMRNFLPLKNFGIKTFRTKVATFELTLFNLILFRSVIFTL